MKIEKDISVSRPLCRTKTTVKRTRDIKYVTFVACEQKDPNHGHLNFNSRRRIRRTLPYRSCTMSQRLIKVSFLTDTRWDNLILMNPSRVSSSVIWYSLYQFLTRSRMIKSLKLFLKNEQKTFVIRSFIPLDLSSSSIFTNFNFRFSSRY